MFSNHQFNTIRVDDGTEVDLYTAFPDQEGNFPALLVLQEAFGVNHHMRSVCERLCKAGYAVAAPDLFHRTARRLEASYTNFPAVMPHLNALTDEGINADLQASYNWLIRQDGVLKDKTGSIGFCLGGRVSFMANILLPVSAAVSYYGGGIDKLTGDAGKLHGAHLFYWGGQDNHIPQDSIDALINALKTAGKEYTNVVVSGAGHGFNCDERESYNPFAAKETWAHTMAFLDNRLK